ncbi:MAG: bifunctional glutamate N-acetyltransferase/amino-acid acetyltransferase ArgJ [Nitrospira sp.]|nr:bifunctional glutamate N-acetyltransferase/amino-acid acetyltransferase ArgJ [Candidatus Manganitrophaceae bacterium]HIL35736.1 bifunctional glutamate N-acetyltransferase/amino-acid acetyltransferase ArgJ [Candidatus Manganitrophaceae bacterium]
MKKQESPPRRLKGGLTAVRGFTAAGLSAGIKKNGRTDLALIVSKTDCSVAGVFTRNCFPAPPLLLDKKHLRNRRGRAIVINSGNANAFTGKRGYQDAEAMAEATAQTLGIPSEWVYVASTGVIGEFLPVKRILQGIPRLALSLSDQGSKAAAEAILTTDTFPKEIAFSAKVGGQTIRVGGIAKGSGMIHPNMATMLAFLTTDVRINPDLLQEALHQAVEHSFHRITVDGDTSTNDMVLLFANETKGEKIRSKGRAFRQFVSLLETTSLALAKMIVRDGEGATKLIEIQVLGARSNPAAHQIAMTIARSSLVKTAFYGEDANWGRIVAAIGNAGIPIRPEKIDLSFGRTPLVKKGIYLGESAESKISNDLKKREICLTVSLNSGKGNASVWTADLSLDYIKINALYRT